MRISWYLHVSLVINIEIYWFSIKILGFPKIDWNLSENFNIDFRILRKIRIGTHFYVTMRTLSLSGFRFDAPDSKLSFELKELSDIFAYWAFQNILLNKLQTKTLKQKAAISNKKYRIFANDYEKRYFPDIIKKTWNLFSTFSFFKILKTFLEFQTWILCFNVNSTRKYIRKTVHVFMTM